MMKLETDPSDLLLGVNLLEFVTGIPSRRMDPKGTTVPKTQSQSKDKDKVQ